MYLEALLAIECERRDRHAIDNRIRDAHNCRASRRSKSSTLRKRSRFRRPHPRVGRRRLYRTQGTDRVDRRLRHGQDALGHGAQCTAPLPAKRRVRFTTAAALVNELVEAVGNQVRKLMTRWQKYELIALDEVRIRSRLADIGAEFLFQVISEQAERAAIIVTTNLPFSEWTTVFPNPRLCKALLDRMHGLSP